VADDLSPHGSNPPGQSAPEQVSSGQDAPGRDSSDRGYPASGPSEEDRERYMRLLDRALERGLLGDGDYMLRADAIARATDIEQMNEIVQRLPVLEVPAKARTARSGGTRQRTDAPVPPQMGVQEPPPIQPPPLKARMPVNVPGDLADQIDVPPFDPDDLSALDAVDVAMLMRSVQVRRAPSTNRRFAALAIVAFLFLALVVLGLYLASHDHTVNTNGIVVAYQSAVSAGPVRL
jgi:hypothetical protein